MNGVDPTKARILVAALLVVLVGLATGGYLWFANRLPEGVALRVDGVNVTELGLADQVQTLGALYGVRAPTDGPQLDTFRRDVAKSIAYTMVVDRAAARRQTVVTDQQASDFLIRYVAAQYGEGQAGHDAYVKDLVDKHTTEPKVLTAIKQQLTLQRLFEQVTADVTVTDQDVRRTFDQRRAEFDTPERREIHYVVVRTKEEADAIVAQLNVGGNLEAVAQQRSIDASTRNNGGNLGLVSAAELQEPFRDVAFAAPVGVIFGPVPSQESQGTAFNVGKVVQSQPGVPADFEKVKDAIRQLVIVERARDKFRGFMERQLKDADVVYADNYRPANPTAPPPAPDQLPR